MALNLKNNKAKGSSGSSKPRDVVPAGQYPARLVRIIDLGLHPKINYKTKKVEGEQYKVRFTYELVNSFLKDENGEDMLDKPRWISEDVNISKALAFDDAPAQPWYANCGIVKRVRALTGNPVATADDLAELLGMACAVLVVHEANKQGKTDAEGNPIVYANVGDVQGDPFAMMGQECPALVNDAKFLDLSDPDMELFEEQPGFIKERILKNLEFSGSVLEARLNGETEVKGKIENDVNTESDETDSDMAW